MDTYDGFNALFSNRCTLNLNFLRFFAEEDARRPNQRPTTAMLGNEVMSKEQCYDLYQQILGVKKFEHQLLYNAMQVSNIKYWSLLSGSYFSIRKFLLHNQAIFAI